MLMSVWTRAVEKGCSNHRLCGRQRSEKQTGQDKRPSSDESEESVGSLPRIRSESLGRNATEKSQDDRRRRKNGERNGGRVEQEELKCTKAFVLVGGTMTTCTTSSKKKQAKIRKKRIEKYERVLDRCKQIPGGFEQKAMAIQVFATPVLCFDSELTLHTETTLTRLDRKVHAILFKSTRWRSQALTFTLLARGHLIHPSQAVRYWEYQNSEKSFARKNRFARNCQSIDQSERRQRRAT